MAMFSRFDQAQEQSYDNRQQHDTGGYVRKIPQYVKRHEDTEADESCVDTEREIVKILSKARTPYVVSLIEKGDEMTQEDMETVAIVQKHIEEEQKQVVEEQQADSFICSLSKCYIEGCIVHTILPACIHYRATGSGTGCYSSIQAMDERTRKGYEVYKNHPNCSYIEVYERHICVIEANGSSTVINE